MARYQHVISALPAGLLKHTPLCVWVNWLHSWRASLCINWNCFGVF